jgi:glycosyltransferase involved in cell wall biosynthesis
MSTSAISTSAPGTLWWVTDQLPYPPRNGVTLPSYHHAVALATCQPLRLVLLVDVASPPDAAALKANEDRFGPILSVPLMRLGRQRRLVDELMGREMFQHGYVGARSDMPRIQPSPCDRLLVTPASAVAKLRASGILDIRQFTASVAMVNDCTAGEYHYRLQERAGDWRHRIKGAIDRLRSRGIGRIERELLKPYTHAVLQTPKDREILAHLVDAGLAERARLAPNGVNEALFGLQGGDRQDIIFMAELSGEYGPIAQWLVTEVWPLLPHEGYRLRIVGKGASPALLELLDRAPGVVHESFVPRLESVYEQAAIAISPVFKGFGLINKTLEAMASGVPVVGGQAAFNGVAGFVAGRHGVVCARADAQLFARELAALMRDRPRQAGIGSEGRALVSGRFRWEASSATIASLLGLPRPTHDGKAG